MPAAIDRLYLTDCAALARKLAGQVDLIYADILYDDWSGVPYTELAASLRPGGAMFIQTDQRSVAEINIYLHLSLDLDLVNWIIWAYDWGGRARDRFGEKHDDILYYRKPGKFTFNAAAVQVPKVALINSTKTHKIPTDVWTGNFYTTSPERIKDPQTGRGYKWQKPEWLLERIIRAASNRGDLVFEPYLGTGTACAVAKKTGRHWVGSDTDSHMLAVARRRLQKLRAEVNR